MSRSTVEVPRGLLIGLVAAAGVGVLAVMFLLGRESGRGSQPLSATSPTTITPAGAEEAPPGAMATPHAEASAPMAAPTAAPVAPATEGSLAFPQLAVPTGVVSPNVAPASHDTMRSAVASYFSEVETIQSRGKSWGDPQALAQTLLEQASKGDVSGFDGLAAANRSVRDALRAVAAPEPCREHHRLTLALLDESIAMLDRVKGLISGADAGSLAAMPGDGQALERKAKDVDAMAAEIKRRFGI